MFCADAVADPLTGMFAALGALAAHRRGGGVLLDIALCDVAAFAGSFVPANVACAKAEVLRRPSPSEKRHDAPAPVQAGADAVDVKAESDAVNQSWSVDCAGVFEEVRPPLARQASAAAAALGADNEDVLGGLKS